MKNQPAGLLVGGLLLLVIAGCQPLPPAAGAPPMTYTAVTEPTALPTTVATAPATETAMPTPASVDVPAATATATPPIEEEPMNATPTPPYDPAAEPLVQRALSDLAERLSVASEEIEVIEVQSVVWPDTAIGCPQPDMMYTQVPQDGAFIRLSAGDNFYNYHYGGRRGLFLCEQVGKSGTPPTFDELQLPGGGGEDI